MITYIFCLIALLLSTPLLSMDPTSPRLRRDTNHAIAPEERRRMEELLITDSQGNTPLHLATNQNVGDHIVQKLIEAMADVNAQNNEGNTPLHLAYRQEIGEQEITQNEQELQNRQKIIYLIQNRQKIIYLIQNRQKIIYLLEAGARINIKNNLGALPYTHTNRLLMWHMYIPLAKAIEAQDNTTVSKLLAQGADPNANIYTIPDNKNHADFLLSIALHSRNATAVRMLLDVGADPNKIGVYDSNDPGPMRVIQVGPEAICQKAIKLGHTNMAQQLITHIPRPLIIKHLNNVSLTLLLCFRRINPSLPQDIRKLLCFYCIKGPILEEHEECAAKVCSQADFGNVTYPNNIHRAIEDKDRFDNTKLTQYYPIWQQQINAVMQQKGTKPTVSDTPTLE